MRKKLLRLAGIIPILTALISQPFESIPTSATAFETRSANQNPGMYIIQPSYVGVSQPLSSLILSHPNILNANSETQERLSIPKTENFADEGFDNSIVQDSQIGTSMPSPLVNFDGINNINLVFPPDTQGDIGYDPSGGTKYYVQWVNLSYQIWDVTDPANIVSLMSPTAGNALWSGTGTICETNNNGDPITQYDHLAHRWLMSQFALGTNNYHQCIAISVSADPTGAWYLYDFQTSTTKMNDYPKFGVWIDGYYMSVNQYTKHGNSYNWEGAGVAVFERESMLTGSPNARMIYIDVGAVNLNYGGMLPSDLDGPAPTAGTPNYFVEWDDSSWIPGDTSDNLRIWEFKTDWANPSNTTFGLNSSYDPNKIIATANVDPNMCGYLPDCIPQPGTTQKLDAISDRVMYRLQYRNFGSYKTLVSNHTVDANGADKAGIHWFELRDTGTGFSMYQQGVYSPDADHRWMASIAMDVSGDIALGFSISSATTYPSVRYAGRLAGDTPGTLPQTEVSLVAGTGSQIGYNRWGDYSMMAVDDSDGCTFWYTQEYYMSGLGYNWQTRIGAFKFPSCAAPTAITLEGTVTDVSSTPIEGASIQVYGGDSTLTDESGHYAFSLKKGVYDVTVSKYGYVSINTPGILVMPPLTTQNFVLENAPFQFLPVIKR